MRPVHVRVTVLLLALAIAAAWAYARLHARSQRVLWDRTLQAVVYVLGPADAAGVEALQRELDRLAARLAEDRAAWSPGPPPFRFEVVGPLAPARLPPAEAPAGALGARLGSALDLWRAERAVRAASPEVDPRAFDVRLYLVVEACPGAACARAFAEGYAEAGGEVGVVRAALGDEPLLAAAAVAHEALHTVGASDKYDAAGHAVAPGGLVEPGRVPAYPQARAELMVGEVPLAPGAGRLPASAEEIGVGAATARELGWAPP